MSMTSWLPGVIVAVLMSGTGWLLLNSQRGKIKAETVDQAVETMVRITAELRMQLERAERRIGVLEESLVKECKRTEALEDDAETMKTMIRGQSAIIAKQTQELGRLRELVRLLTLQVKQANLIPVCELEPPG